MDKVLQQLDVTARETLVCSPYDGYAWLALHWTTGSREGFHGRAIDFLSMSYGTTPREGWIAILRNPQVVKSFPGLPEPLRLKLATEWS